MKPLLKQHFLGYISVMMENVYCFIILMLFATKRKVLYHMHVISLCKLYSTYLILTKTVMGERHDLVHSVK